MRTAQELNSLALRTRRLWNEDGYSPIDIFAIVNGWKDKKITIVRYPLSSRISGMCTKEKDDIVICINSTTSYGRQRFTLAHELYHVLYEEGMQRVICDMSMNGNKSDSEKEADQFASYLLMPYDALLVYDNLLDNEVADKYKSITVSTVAAKLGYGKELYFPTDEKKQYFTTGEYIRKVEKMAEKGLISEGKKEELLMDAYRADIVYNFDEEETNLND